MTRDSDTGQPPPRPPYYVAPRSAAVPLAHPTRHSAAGISLPAPSWRSGAAAPPPAHVHSARHAATAPLLVPSLSVGGLETAAASSRADSTHPSRTGHAQHYRYHPHQNHRYHQQHDNLQTPQNLAGPRLASPEYATELRRLQQTLARVSEQHLAFSQGKSLGGGLDAGAGLGTNGNGNLNSGGDGGAGAGGLPYHLGVNPSLLSYQHQQPYSGEDIASGVGEGGGGGGSEEGGGGGYQYTRAHAPAQLPRTEATPTEFTRIRRNCARRSLPPDSDGRSRDNNGSSENVSEYTHPSNPNLYQHAHIHAGSTPETAVETAPATIPTSAVDVASIKKRVCTPTPTPTKHTTRARTRGRGRPRKLTRARTKASNGGAKTPGEQAKLAEEPLEEEDDDVVVVENMSTPLPALPSPPIALYPPTRQFAPPPPSPQPPSPPGQGYEQTAQTYISRSVRINAILAVLHPEFEILSASERSLASYPCTPEWGQQRLLVLGLLEDSYGVLETGFRQAAAEAERLLAQGAAGKEAERDGNEVNGNGKSASGGRDGDGDGDCDGKMWAEQKAVFEMWAQEAVVGAQAARARM